MDNLSEHRKFCRLVLGLLLCVLFAAAAMNYIVDPYNMFSSGKHFDNLLKPEAKVQERVTKIIGLKFDKRKLDSVFVGTSRADWALSKAYFKKLTGKEAENLAMAGLTIEEYTDIINTALKIHPEIKNIYFGLDYGVLMKDGLEEENNNRAKITSNPKIDYSEIGTAFLSLNTTGNSIWTVVKNLSGIKRRMYDSNGLKQLYEDEEIENEFVYTLGLYSNYGNSKIDFDKLDTLKKIYDDCAKKGVTLHIFMMPTHVSDLYSIYRLNGWNTYSDWKKEIVKFAPIQDFGQVNEFSTEKISPRMKYFFEPSHATYLYGEKILEDLVNETENYSRILKPHNVDYYNKRLYQDIEEWYRKNKTSADEMTAKINKKKEEKK